MSLSCELVDLSGLWNAYFQATLGILTQRKKVPLTEKGAASFSKGSIFIAAGIYTSGTAECVQEPAESFVDPFTPPAIPEELIILSHPELGQAAFHAPSYTLLRLDAASAAVLGDLCERSLSLLETARRNGVGLEEIKALLAKVNRIIAAQGPVTPVYETPEVLNKLVLNVSQTCNLGCEYCYANGGSYGQDTPMMSLETAQRAVEQVFAVFPRVKTVLFFGGEPSLNPEVIRAVCAHIHKLYQAGEIPSLPRLGMVTNGLLLKPEMLECIRDYNLEVTVSLEGPPQINEQLRPSKPGQKDRRAPAQGSYLHIAKNIRRIQDATDGRQPSRIECTYTAAHQQAGLDITQLSLYFAEKFGIWEVYIAPVSLPPGHSLELQLDAGAQDGVEMASVEMLQSWLTDAPRSDPNLWASLAPLLTRESLPYLCDGATNELAIASNGQIYPCQTLIQERFLMGDVYSPNVFDRAAFQTVQDDFRKSAKSSIDPCSRCWMRGMCRICLGALYKHSGDFNTPPPAPCAANQRITRAVLLTLSHLQKDPEQWRQFCATAGEMLSQLMPASQHLSQGGVIRRSMVSISTWR